MAKECEKCGVFFFFTNEYIEKEVTGKGIYYGRCKSWIITGTRKYYVSCPICDKVNLIDMESFVKHKKRKRR